MAHNVKVVILIIQDHNPSVQDPADMTIEYYTKTRFFTYLVKSTILGYIIYYILDIISPPPATVLHNSHSLTLSSRKYLTIQMFRQ